MNSTPQQQFKFLVDESTDALLMGGEQRGHTERSRSTQTPNPKFQTSNFKDPAAARQRAAVRRWKVIENLDRYLIEFEANFNKAGAKVLWARDVEEAQLAINEVLTKNFVKEVYTAGTGVINEIDLHNFLNSEDIKISSLDDADALTSVVITEASFFIADPGVIVLGKVSRALQTAFAKSRCVIAVAGINDVLPNLGDLSLFLPLKTLHSKTTETDTTLLFGPRQQNEEVTRELYFLIVDNGRSNLLADKQMRQSTWCINCGACNTVCPVATTIGIKDGVYEGPIKAAQMPFVKDFEEHQYVTRASTLCGACTQVCPVHIKLHELFIHNRHKAVALQLTPQKEKWFYLLWKKTMLKRDKFNIGGFKSNRLVMETVYEKVWGIKETLPPFAKKSFNQMWKEREK
ncbi:MAG: 4Fe-4S dicluster domain-containing protein [Bacteroidia bacterium]